MILMNGMCATESIQRESVTNVFVFVPKKKLVRNFSLVDGSFAMENE